MLCNLTDYWEIILTDHKMKDRVNCEKKEEGVKKNKKRKTSENLCIH